MICMQIASMVAEHFADADRYKQFKAFRDNPEYQDYWSLCMAAVMDQELLGHIIFCNDLFRIPPVKTFLVYYTRALQELTGDPKAVIDPYVKKAIGAFWGMVFKYVLGYRSQESVSVSLYDHFVVKTATCFHDPAEKVVLEG